MTIDLAAIRFRLLRSYRVDVPHDSAALEAACQDIAALVARVEELERVYEPDVRQRQADREVD